MIFERNEELGKLVREYMSDELEVFTDNIVRSGLECAIMTAFEEYSQKELVPTSIEVLSDDKVILRFTKYYCIEYNIVKNSDLYVELIPIQYN